MELILRAFAGRGHFDEAGLEAAKTLAELSALEAQLAEIAQTAGPIQERLASRGVRLEYGDAVRDFLIEKGYKPEYGARQLRRVVEQYIEDPLSEQILRGTFPQGVQILIEPGDGKLVFRPGEVTAKVAAEHEG